MPPSTLELLNASVRLYKENKMLFLKYSLPVVLFGIVANLIKLYFTPVLQNNPSFPAIAVASVLVSILYILTLWSLIALVRTISNRYNAVPVTGFWKEFLSSVTIILPALLTSILVALVVLGGFFLFVIPAIIFSVWFIFSMYAVIIDKRKGTSALRMSKALVKGYWWDILWLSISTSFIVLGVSFLAKSIIRFVFTFLGGIIPSGEVVMGMIGLLVVLAVYFIMTPMSFLPTTILYNQIKKAKNIQ